MRPAFLLVLALVAAPAARLGAQASHDWNTTHVVLASTATLGILIDWAQTRQAMHQGWGERNPILGWHPSTGKLAAYNVLAIGGMLSIGALLPSHWRTAWFSGVTALEAYTIAGNARLGLHIGF